MATADGTAIAGADYVAATGTVSFAPGVNSRTFTVAIVGDVEDELNESFRVVLSNPNGGVTKRPFGLCEIDMGTFG